jgi:transcriptional regulator with XRE-family HTH domain
VVARDTQGTQMSNSASFGYWVRRRRLALDLTQAALAKRVGCSVPTIKKIERDERRPSKTMATRLAESLSVPVEEHDRFVAMAVGERSPQREALATGPVSDPGERPRWLADVAEAGTDPGFVGRERELAVLEQQLAEARAGRGRIVFAAGEAGQGKTALLTAFAQRAQASDADLVVARGYATAAAGLGDPYLPFRDLFLMLVAAPEAGWQADQLTPDQAERLWRFAPTTARTLRDVGPQLLDTIVPGAAVRERLGVGRAARQAPAAGQPLRDQLFTQVTAVLSALAEQRPLLLLLDDLQWTDAASAELLFHLRRRMGGSRVMILGAYRPSEVAEVSAPARGPCARSFSKPASTIRTPRSTSKRSTSTRAGPCATRSSTGSRTGSTRTSAPACTGRRAASRCSSWSSCGRCRCAARSSVTTRDGSCRPGRWTGRRCRPA